MNAVLDKKIYSRTVGKETYQIYSLSNKKRIDGKTYIYFDDCAAILREKHKLGENEDLIIFKIEYTYPYFKIPIIEYQIFNKNGMKKLNLNHCKKVKVLYYIPKEINDYKEYKYNPKHPYYSEKCFHIDEDFSTDLVLYDRKNEFNKNNMSLCESICTFKGYVNNEIICECNVKLKFNSFLNTNSDKYNLIYRFEVNETNENNFWVVNCFLNHKLNFLLLFNLCSIFNILIYIIIITGAVLFRLKEFKPLNLKIKKYIQACLIAKQENGEIKMGEIGNSYIEEEEEEINENSKDKKKVKFEKNKYGDNNETVNEETKNDNCDISKYKSKNTSGEILTIKSNKIFKSKKRALIDLNKDKKKKKEQKMANKDLIENSQNTSYLNSKAPFDKKAILNNSKNINKIALNKKRKKEYTIRTDYELENLSYEDARIFDKRTCWEYYVSLIRRKHIIAFVFFPKYKFHSRIIYFCFLAFLFPLYLAVNTFFVDASTIHNIYISQGPFDIVYNIPKIVIATFILYLLQKILSFFISTEADILEIKSIERKNLVEEIKEKIRFITIKFILFFATSLIILNLCGYYIGCFAAIFPKTKLHLFVRLLISFTISLIIPIVLNIPPAVFRSKSLKRHGNEDLYRISQYLLLL